MLRLGILGGTFDPPHMGHLILAEYALDDLRLDKLLFVPAGEPPHKVGQQIMPVWHRVAMLELATAGNDHFEISLVDVERPGPHYTVDMLRIIKQQYDNAELYFVMGGDSFRELPTWERAEGLTSLCTLAVRRRPPKEEVQPTMHEDVLPDLAKHTIVFDAPPVGISSTNIVHRIRNHKSIRYLVPDAVMTYIHNERIYR